LVLADRPFNGTTWPGRAARVVAVCAPGPLNLQGPPGLLHALSFALAVLTPDSPLGEFQVPQTVFFESRSGGDGVDCSIRAGPCHAPIVRPGLEGAALARVYGRNGP
jgi:hypothetical protein